jgi:hypothetical protein
LRIVGRSPNPPDLKTLYRAARTTAETVSASASIPNLAFNSRIESSVMGFLVSRAAARAIDRASRFNIAVS